jgi:hypothetical protein
MNDARVDTLPLSPWMSGAQQDVSGQDGESGPA